MKTWKWSELRDRLPEDVRQRLDARVAKTPPALVAVKPVHYGAIVRWAIEVHGVQIGEYANREETERTAMAISDAVAEYIAAHFEPLVPRKDPTQ